MGDFDYYGDMHFDSNRWGDMDFNWELAGDDIPSQPNKRPIFTTTLYDLQSRELYRPESPVKPVEDLYIPPKDAHFSYVDLSFYKK